MNRISQFQQPCDPQASSALFCILPGEIREAIYIEVLTSYSDESRTYHSNTPYRRPGYLGTHKSDSALLQTCQLAYNEAWFRPWVSRVHTFWLTALERRPDKESMLTPQRLQTFLNLVHEKHGEMHLSHVRVFAQLCEARRISPVLKLNHFYPRVFTLTLRHHDWWFWERDNRLHIGDDLPLQFSMGLPASLQELRMELESIQRRKNQIDYVADKMVQLWHFPRADGVVMTAQAKDFEIDGWRGSSIWEGRRWLRDETAPETLEYYIKTVVWRPTRLEEPGSLDAHRLPEITVPNSFPALDPQNMDSILVQKLDNIGVEPGCPAEEVRRRLEQTNRPTWRRTRVPGVPLGGTPS